SRTRRLAVGPDGLGGPARTRLPRPRRRVPADLRVPGSGPRDALPDVIGFWRVFFVGGLLAYRALFNWIRPWIYIPTMLGSPLFQLVFFTKLGQYSGAGDKSFFVVGNAVQVCAMSSVYGMTMAVANERWFGTLGPLLASPANRLAG